MKKLFPLILVFSVSISFGQLPNTLTPADKVYGLSKFWQEVNYNFVYINKVDRVKWDSAYLHLITTVQKTENDYQYYKELQKFCALLKDGHTDVFMPNSLNRLNMNSMFGDYKIFTSNINSKAIIVRTNLSKKDEIPIGSEIIEVNGLPTKEYLQKYITPYISSSTDYVLEDRSIKNILQGLKNEKIKLKLRKPNNEILTLNLIHSETNEQEDVFPPIEKPKGLLEFKWLENKIAYLSLNSFEDPKIDTLFINLLPQLYNAKALIIDLRSNGGGNTEIGSAILKYLTNDKLLYGAKSLTRLHIPTYKAWGAFLEPKDTLKEKAEWGMTQQEIAKCFLIANDNYYYNFNYSSDTNSLNAKRIVIPTAILIGHNTASAAEDFLIYADNQKHMTKFGVNSFGSTGQPFLFDLPGGGSARICTKKDTYSDDREFVGFGIKPDFEIKKTLTDFLLKKDPVLKKP